MQYFAGIFDADGYISLLKTGRFIIGLEKSNEVIPNMLADRFGGHIYKRKRDKRKTTFIWMIPSDRDKSLAFIEQINAFTHIKTPQLNLLKTYLNHSRDGRKNIRADYVHQIAEKKKPIPYTREQLKIPSIVTPDEHFWKWFAGFMDGDGNFTVFEYQNGPRRTFDSWIGAFNTFGEPIIYIKERIDGSISQYIGNKFPIWKWVCSQNTSNLVCNSLQPYLINRKIQCQLVSEYLKIHVTKTRGIDLPDQTITVIRDIIKQIKHHNSL